MPDEDAIHLYATHLWALDEDYLRLFDYLGDVENFYYVNHSDPEAEPETGSALDYRDVLAEQIEAAEVVIVLSTQHFQNPELIDLQIATAKRRGKPILTIEPFGPDPVPDDIKQLSDHVVEWYARKIVDAIKMLGRGEEIHRYDTIEWPGDL